MMELSVWEQGEQIGTVTAQQDGLFYIFICKISKHAEQLRRIYVISPNRFVRILSTSLYKYGSGYSAILLRKSRIRSKQSRSISIAV